MAKSLKNFTLSELSAVDKAAQEGATSRILKRDFSDSKRKELAASGAALPDGSYPIENVGDLHNAIQAVGRASDEAAAKAHIITRAKALGATDQLPESWKVKKAGPSGGPDNKELDMSVITKALGLPDTASEADITAAITKRETDAAATVEVNKAAALKLAEMQKALDDQKVFAAMSDVEKAFHAKLEKADPKAAADFAAKKPADKKKQMNDADADDEVMKMAGIEVRKSEVGVTQFAVMKALAAENETAKAEIAKAADRELTAELKADVAKNFAHVAGTESEKIEMLKALRSLPEAVQKAQRAIMTSAEALAKSAFKMTGHSGGVDQDPDSPEAEVEKRAEEIAKTKGISINKARVEFMDTHEFQQIMKRAQ